MNFLNEHAYRKGDTRRSNIRRGRKCFMHLFLPLTYVLL